MGKDGAWSVDRPAEELVIDYVHLLTLSAPETTVLVGGLRVLNADAGGGPLAQLGVFTKQPEKLTSEFFINLLDTNSTWEKSKICDHFYGGHDRMTSGLKWTASSVDLVFGSNSQLRATSDSTAKLLQQGSPAIQMKSTVVSSIINSAQNDVDPRTWTDPQLQSN